MGVEELKIGSLRLDDLGKKDRFEIDIGSLSTDLNLDEESLKRLLSSENLQTEDRVERVRSLDFDKILSIHAKNLNRDLCLFFFERARIEKDFTDEEVEMYRDSYSSFFETCFRVGENFVYRFEDRPEAKNLLISLDGDMFQLTIFKGRNLILHLPDLSLKDLI